MCYIASNCLHYVANITSTSNWMLLPDNIHATFHGRQRIWHNSSTHRATDANMCSPFEEDLSSKNALLAMCVCVHIRRMQNQLQMCEDLPLGNARFDAKRCDAMLCIIMHNIFSHMSMYRIV